MNISLLKPAALLTTALLCAGPAFAQVKTEPLRPVPPKPAPAPSAPSAAPVPMTVTTFGGVPAAPAPAPRKLTTLKVPDTELESAVHMLQSMLEDSGLEQLNILFGPETKNLEVTALTLRNVTGPDALQLIAAAAGCTVEPMFSTETQTPPGFGVVGNHKFSVIGYQLRGKPKTTTTARNANQSPMLPPNGLATPVPITPMMTPGAAMLTGPGGNMGLRLPSATSPASRVTRIYPLGAVTTATKFPEIEKTIRDTLKADNVAENQVSLALHEKTNVLVVNAAEPVHALVEQLLTALNSNASQAERQSAARDRAMGREELESALRARERLAKELDERDAMMRELQRELRKLQDAVQKTPSAK